MHKTPGRRRTLLALAGAGALLAPLATGGASWAAPEISLGGDGTYIVMLKDNPVASYEGGVQGFAATKAAEGHKLDAHSPAAQSYADYLIDKQDQVLRSVGASSSDKTYEYTTVLNGFAADLSGAEANALRKSPDVLAVWEDELRHADTTTTPDYLGMTGEDGVWQTEFGGPADAGEGVIVGVIDSGIWPENPSFADLPGTPAPPEGWAGECETGTDPDPEGNIECNSKLIGARYYVGANNTAYDFLSPRDTNGHGSHTAGTAAGNHGVDLTVYETEMGKASGMAPAAHIAAYKALWQTADGGGSGMTSGLVAAINDAVADGVDVINYSVSGSSTSVVGADEIAFLNAAHAGVFVSASAGNSGDTVGVSSVAHNSPWVMTVAASTHDRNVNKTVDLGEGTDIVDRISGKNRYETAAQIALQGHESADTVYIATGDQFADALAGAAPAAKGMVPSGGLEAAPEVAPDGSAAPVLLTRVDSLPSVTASAIEALGATNIVILGGSNAVSDAVEDELAELGTVTRVSGKDRFETAAALASQFGPVEHVYVANGQGNNFPDALSGSALAGSEGVPVLLVRADSVPGSVSQALTALGNPEVVVLGGDGAVSDAVATELGATERIAGSNRYGTANAVAERFGYSSENPAPVNFVATGADYPDALAGSALAGYLDVPVMLSRQADVPSSTLETMVGMDPSWVTILGGTGALSQQVEDTLEATFNAASEAQYEGVGVGEGVGPAPLVDSTMIAAEGASEQDALLCAPGSLDATEAEGKIVICTRGSYDRVAKSAEVAAAGGIGMILANNNNTESLNADFHAVPTIHVDGTTGAAIKAYAESDPNPMATISPMGVGEPPVAPAMAGFSSYGPALAGGGDVLKPDITAPGVDVLAAVSPAGDPGTMFNSMSGTSMSAPHIAGLAALMVDKYPGWSPMAIKSSMMTTADPTNSAGGPITYAGEPASPLHYGSGEVEPATAYETPLVYESVRADWYAYACAIGQLQTVGNGAEVCAQLPEIDPSDLNYPSIAVGQLAGSQTVTRTVTATGAGGTFTASTEAPEGMSVVVEPSTITVGAGESATFEVTISNESAPVDQWTFGSITWTGPGADVRSPIAVNPVAVAAPAELVISGTEGSQSYELIPGQSGTMNSVVHGLVPADSQEVSVPSDGPGGGGSIADEVVEITVPQGAAALRVEVWQDEWTSPNGADLDLDLFLANAQGQVIAQSAAGGSDEQITLLAPAPGTYLVAIDHWDGAAGDVATGPLHIYTPTDDEGNLDVTPSPAEVTVGQPITLTAAWSGLQAATRYLGVIGYDFGAGEEGFTLVTVTP